jgi:hypothetical protein
MSKQRNIRKRRILEEEDEVEGIDEPQVTAEDVKLLQKERQRRPVCIFETKRALGG